MVTLLQLLVSKEQAEVCSLDYKLAVVPVKIKACNGSNIIQTNTFLDPGCSAMFCTANLIEKLHVRGMRIEEFSGPM